MWWMVWLSLACHSGQQDTAGDLATSGSFVALTYNVHGLPAAITGDDTLGRMEGIAPLLPEFPLIALQETFDASGHELVTAQCHHQTQHWFDEPLSDRVYGSGLTLLADWPELAYDEQHYSECNGLLDASADCMASKGFQMSRLRLGAGSLDVYNTHHEAGGDGADDAVRQTQVEEVLAAMQDLSPGQAILFMGDFNLEWDDEQDQPLLAQYEEAGFVDACQVVDCPEPDRIDHALLRQGDSVALEVLSWAVETRFVDDEGVSLSDHDALSFGIGWQVQ